MIGCVVETNGKKSLRESTTPGTQADDELREMLAAADPAVEASLDSLSLSEEHYFAAVHQEGNRVPTAISSSAEV
jgi:hypothetical protein